MSGRAPAFRSLVRKAGYRNAFTATAFKMTLVQLMYWSTILTKKIQNAFSNYTPIF